MKYKRSTIQKRHVSTGNIKTSQWGRDKRRTRAHERCVCSLTPFETGCGRHSSPAPQVCLGGGGGEDARYIANGGTGGPGSRVRLFFHRELSREKERAYRYALLSSRISMYVCMWVYVCACARARARVCVCVCVCVGVLASISLSTRGDFIP